MAARWAPVVGSPPLRLQGDRGVSCSGASCLFTSDLGPSSSWTAGTPSSGAATSGGAGLRTPFPALTVPSPLSDGRAQVCGQHRPGPPLPLAGGRAVQLWSLPEGCLLHAVAGEMRCWLGQGPRGPSAPLQPGRPSEPPPSGRWRPCPEPLLQNPGLLDGGVRVSPGPELGFSAGPCAQLPPEALPTPFFLGQKAMPCPGPEAGSGSHVHVGTVSGPELASVLREGPWTFSLEAPLAWPKPEAPWGWLTLHTSVRPL